MADDGADEGWHLVVSHPAVEIREEKQIEEWERSKGHWSGLGKHPVQWQDHRMVKVMGDRELGVGSYGLVQRVTYRTVTMARKHVKPRRGITVEKLREEANAMERLVHKHILRLIGTYTLKRSDLYLLLYPAAVCDLSKLLEDIDDIRSGASDREDAFQRLRNLGLKDVGTIDDLSQLRNPSQATHGFSRTETAVGFLQQTLGCIVEALVYVHHNGIRHRDLKPKNILLSPGRVYLADFGIARDVRESEDSITSGRYGTLSWIAPEVHDEQNHHMSPADIWSLGFIFLNVATVLYGEGLDRFDSILKERDWKLKYEMLPKYLVALRAKAIAASLDNQEQPNFNCKHILSLIDNMLKYVPGERPTAVDVNERLLELGGLDQIYHLSCCHKKNAQISKVINIKLKSVYDNSMNSATKLIQMREELDAKQKRIEELESIHGTFQQRIEKERKHAGEQYKALQEKLNREVEARKQLEERLKALQTKPRRPGSQNRGRGRGLSHLHIQSGSNINSHPRPNGNVGIGKTSPAPESVFGPIQRRQSRVPLPVRPSTPIRPALNRDPVSTSSTLVSSIHSTFSRTSLKTNDSASSISSETIRSVSPESPTRKAPPSPVLTLTPLSQPVFVEAKTVVATVRPSWAKVARSASNV